MIYIVKIIQTEIQAKLKTHQPNLNIARGKFTSRTDQVDRQSELKCKLEEHKQICKNIKRI